MSPLTPHTAAVVTVSYNSSAELEPFLASIVADAGDLADIVIADNASSDVADSEIVAARFGARLLALRENRGYGGAINAAVEVLADSVRYILISNPDVTVSPGTIETLVAAIESSSDIGAVGPRVMNEDGSPYPSARAFPSLRTGVGHALFGTVWPSNPWSRAYRADDSESSEPRDVGWLSGSCLLVRRDAFLRLGGFDEGYFMYFEDVDLGYRLDKAGLRRVLIPAATVVHTGAHSTTSESARMIQAHHDSAYRYLGKKYRGPVLAPLRLALRWGLSLRAWYLTRRA